MEDTDLLDLRTLPGPHFYPRLLERFQNVPEDPAKPWICCQLLTLPK